MSVTTIQDSPELSATLNMSIEKLVLSRRSHNVLLGAGINTIGDLVQRSEKALLHSKNFGRKSLQEVRDALADKGLMFGVRVVSPIVLVRDLPEVRRVIAALTVLEGMDTEVLVAVANRRPAERLKTLLDIQNVMAEQEAAS